LKTGSSGRIVVVMGLDVAVKLIDVHNDGSSEDNILEEGSVERCGELIVGENRAKIMRVNAGESRIPLFRVDVPSSSQCIGFTPEPTRTEPDNHIEMAKIFRPPYLPTGKGLRRGKVLEVLVIGDNVDLERSTLKIMTPVSKSIKNSE
jgi:hypothetical protein